MSVSSISDTEIEAAPTSLDSSSDDEAICISEVRRCNRFRLICDELRLDRSITFELSSEAFADMFDSQITHARRVIDRLLDEGYVRSFKVGITHLPKDRYYSSRYGYQRSGYSKMVLLAVHDDSDFIKNMEIDLLLIYRRLDRRGFLVNINGHPLCANRAPGGEGADHGIAPFFLYVAFMTNPRTLERCSALERPCTVRNLIEHFPRFVDILRPSGMKCSGAS